MKDVEIVLFGTDGSTKTDKVFNLIAFLGKFYIYKCRINKIKPHIDTFIRELKYKYTVEKFEHCLQMQLSDFQNKWLPYIKLVET